jgi:hypothetical protein
MARDQEYLLYPVDTGDDPRCPSCGEVMKLFSHDAREDKPDILTFSCARCERSERLLCEK